MRLGRTPGWAASIAVLSLARARGMEAGPPLPRGLPPDLWERQVPPEKPVTPERVALEPGKGHSTGPGAG